MSRSKNNVEEKSFIELSKGLSWLLRHAAPNENIHVDSGGYVDIKTILNHRRFKTFSLEDIQKVVSGSDKQRFAIRTNPENGELQIKANQGHTFEIEEHGLTPITDSNEFPIVIHGTYMKVWESIKRTGLSRMKRNHIHFAPGERGDRAVISGMRNSTDIYIYIDLKKALADGLEFFLSENNVILSSGNATGILETKYFSKVINSKTGAVIPF